MSMPPATPADALAEWRQLKALVEDLLSSPDAFPRYCEAVIGAAPWVEVSRRLISTREVRRYPQGMHIVVEYEETWEITKKRDTSHALQLIEARRQQIIRSLGAAVAARLVLSSLAAQMMAEERSSGGPVPQEDRSYGAPPEETKSFLQECGMLLYFVPVVGDVLMIKDGVNSIREGHAFAGVCEIALGTVGLLLAAACAVGPLSKIAVRKGGRVITKSTASLQKAVEKAALEAGKGSISMTAREYAIHGVHQVVHKPQLIHISDAGINVVHTRPPPAHLGLVTRPDCVRKQVSLWSTMLRDEVHVIAEDEAIRDLPRLIAEFGPGTWQKVSCNFKDAAGKVMAEWHWYRRLEDSINLEFKLKHSIWR